MTKLSCLQAWRYWEFGPNGVGDQFIEQRAALRAFETHDLFHTNDTV